MTSTPLQVFENCPRGHPTRRMDTYPHGNCYFYVGAPLGGVLAKALTIGKALTRGTGSYSFCLIRVSGGTQIRTVGLPRPMGVFPFLDSELVALTSRLCFFFGLFGEYVV